MVELTEREKQLYEERQVIAIEIIDKINILIACEWDSDTIKIKLEKLMRDFNKIEDEINVLNPD